MKEMPFQPLVFGHVLGENQPSKLSPLDWERQAMSGNRRDADHAHSPPSRMQAAALGLAGSMVLSATCVACGGSHSLALPPAPSVGSPPVAVSGPPPPPAITSISPKAGAEAGGERVTILGTSFSDATKVEFGNTETESFTVNSDTMITAMSPPAHAPGSVYVSVVTPYGSSADNSADVFKYIAELPTSAAMAAELASPIASIRLYTGSLS